MNSEDNNNEVIPSKEVNPMDFFPWVKIYKNQEEAIKSFKNIIDYNTEFEDSDVYRIKYMKINKRYFNCRFPGELYKRYHFKRKSGTWNLCNWLTYFFF